MNVSGHLLSTAQIESALVEHSSISEAAVVGFPHDVKGNGIYCFVTPKNVSFILHNTVVSCFMLEIQGFLYFLGCFLCIKFSYVRGISLPVIAYAFLLKYLLWFTWVRTLKL